MYIYIQQFWDARCHQEFTPCPEAFVTLLPEHKEKFKEAKQTRSQLTSNGDYPLVICYSLLLKIVIFLLDLPIKNGDFPWLC